MLPRPLRCGALLLALLAVAACSTARQREQPVGAGALLQYRDPATAQLFRESYRTGSLYVEFRPALLVDAIAQDRPYRARYLEMLRTRLMLPDAELARVREEQEREFTTQFSLLVMVYEGTNRPAELTRSDATWRLFLRDDDGGLHAPSAIHRIPDDHPTYLYVNQYFQGLDRWSRMYRVDFPKLTKEVIGQPVGPHPIELVVTGVRGTVTLRWGDAGRFYAPATPATPAASAAAGVEAPNGALR